MVWYKQLQKLLQMFSLIHTCIWHAGIYAENCHFGDKIQAHQTFLIIFGNNITYFRREKLVLKSWKYQYCHLASPWSVCYLRGCSLLPAPCRITPNSSRAWHSWILEGHNYANFVSGHIIPNASVIYPLQGCYVRLMNYSESVSFGDLLKSW